MKILFRVFMIVAIIAPQSLMQASGQEIQKVFLDKDLQKTNYEDFASYYRVELPSDNGGPIAFRLFSKSGKLLSEGKAISFDYTDFSNNKYIGEIEYFDDNENVRIRRVYEQPGTLDDEHIYIEFDENGLVTYNGIRKDGKFSGEVINYQDNIVESKLSVVDDALNGDCISYWPDGYIKSSISFEKGVLKGKSEYFYPNGKLQCRETYDNGLLNGEYEDYSEKGNLTTKAFFKNGVPVGEVENRDVAKKSKAVWYEMELPEDAPFAISVRPFRYECIIDKKFGGQNAKTAAGYQVSYSKDHYNLVRFDFLISNTTDDEVVFDIENVTLHPEYGKLFVFSTDKGGENVAILQDDAKRIFESHYVYAQNKAMKNASKKAKDAASSTTYSVGTSSTRTLSNTNTVKASAAGSAGYGAVIGSGGYAVGGGAGAGVAVGASAKKQSVFSTTSAGVRTSSFDNGTYYNVFELEKAKAQSYIQDVYEGTEEEIEKVTTENVRIRPKESVSKVIVGSDQLVEKFVVSFTINGKTYSVTIKYSNIPNYYDNVDPAA